MSLYNQFTTPEQNLIDLLRKQGGPNPLIGQEAFAVLATKAILNVSQPSGGSLTETQGDARYLRQSQNFSDVPNKPQALANIGGLAATPFLLALAAIGAGIVVKKGDGTATARTLATSGSGLSIANPSGDAGNPTFSLATLLQQISALTLLDGQGIIRNGVNLAAVSLRDSSIGGVPTYVPAGRTYSVIAETQCPFTFTIDVDGQMNIDGLLYSV